MDANTQSEQLSIFQQIVSQFFEMQKVGDFEKQHYILEYGGQDRISVVSEDEKQVEKFIEGFFRTCVSQMKLMKKDDNTLIVPCIFRFLDSTINDKSSSTTKPVEIEIKSIKVPILHRLYFIAR
jgi:hypothetical protein